MKRITNIFFASSVLALTAASCADDLGNYTYHDINEVSVVADPSDPNALVAEKTYSVISHVDRLTFDPQLKSTMGRDDENNYTYEWRVLPEGADVSNVDTTKIVVSRERKLDIPVTLKAGKYSAFFCVRDKDSGITWTTPFTLSVRSLTSEGWLVLCEDAQEQARIDIVFNKDASDDLVARDVFSGQDFKTGKGAKLFYNYTVGDPTTMLVTDKGTWCLNVDDLHAGDDNDLIWRFGVTPESVRLKAAAVPMWAGKNLWVVINEKDEIYALDRSTWGSYFEYPLNLISGKTAFTPAPFVGTNINKNASMEGQEGHHPAVIYDETHSQFLMLKADSQYPVVMNFKGTKLFDNPTGNRTMVHLENTPSGPIKCVLRDRDNGETYYYSMCLKSEMIDPPYWWMDPEYTPYNTQEAYCRIIGPEVEKADKFAFHHLWNYVFYSVGNKIYQFDLSTPDTPAVLAMTLPGETIKVMRFNPFVAWTAYQDWERSRGYQLLVGTDVAGKADNECGVMRLYEVPNLMAPLKEVKKVEGFGKIKDILYKERRR